MINLQRIEQLLKQILEEKINTEILQESTPSHDTGDVARAVADKEAGAVLLDQKRIQIVQVKAALLRIREKTFGICESCERSIEEKRINSVPWTPLCVECQGLMENGALEGFEHLQPKLTRNRMIMQA